HGIKTGMGFTLITMKSCAGFTEQTTETTHRPATPLPCRSEERGGTDDIRAMIANESCLFRITAADRQKLERLLFKRYPHREWGTFFHFGYRQPSWGLHVTYVNAMEPRPYDLKQTSGIVEFEAEYILRAQFALAQTPLAMGVIHSHPQ